MIGKNHYYLAIIPILVFERIKPFFSGIPDPFLYLGYAIDFQGLQERWGSTYYAARLSIIFPLWVQNQFSFSTLWWRYLTIAVFTFVVYSILKNRYGSWNAALGAVVCTNIPWVLRHFSDDYVFSVGAIYVTFALLYFYRDRNELHFSLPLILSGIFSSLAFNAHYVYALVLFPIFLGSFIVRKKPIRSLIRETKLLIVGFLIGTTAISSTLFALSGETGLGNIIKSFKTIFRVTGDQGAIWTRPVSLFFPIYILIILIPLLAFMVFSRRDIKDNVYGRKIGTELSTGVILMSALSIFWHFIIGGPVLSWTIYCSIYLAPIVVLCAMLICEIQPRYSIVHLLLGIVVIIAVMNISTRHFSSQSLSTLRIFVILLFVGSFIAILRRNESNFSNFIISFTAYAAILLLPLSLSSKSFFFDFRGTTAVQGEYVDYLSTMPNIEQRDSRELAAKFAKAIKNDFPGASYGWTIYPQTPSWLGAIDATQLWGYSCYKCMDIRGYQIERTYRPFSKIDTSELSKRDYIVMFDLDQKELEKTHQELLNVSPEFKVTKELVHASGKLNLYVVYLKKVVNS